MSESGLDELRKELRGKKGLVKEFLDSKIEFFSEENGNRNWMEPFNQKSLRFMWAVRKVADFDEELALSCFEEGFGMLSWTLDHFQQRLDRTTHQY